MSLYRNYRPQKFEDLLGQPEIVQTLRHQLDKGNFSHAYLFIGPKGVGKTSTARIFAKVLNCQNPKDGEPCDKCLSCQSVTTSSNLDVIEIDAASNRGIDEIRDLREKIKLAPIQGKFKVYIIDEVHMLTTEAFNALLKTLEEPPKHAVFILCTTEVHKVPATIISRCIRFEFDPAGKEDLSTLLKKVARREKIDLDAEAAEAIVAAAGGSYRDALTTLEQVSAGGKVSAERVLKLTRRDSQAEKLLEKVMSGNTISGIEYVSSVSLAGGNLEYLTSEIVGLLRLRLLDAVKSGSVAEQKRLTDLIRIFSRAYLDLKNAVLPTLPLDLALVEAAGGEVVSAIPIREELQDESKITLAAASVETPSADLDKLKGKWSELLQSVKPFNHSLEAFLRGCEPVEFSGNIVTLRFFYKFHKDMVDQTKNKSLVEKKISDLVGKEIRLKTILGEKPPVKKVRLEEVKNISEVSDEDLVKKAVEIFNSGVN